MNNHRIQKLLSFHPIHLLLRCLIQHFLHFSHVLHIFYDHMFITNLGILSLSLKIIMVNHNLKGLLINNHSIHLILFRLFINLINFRLVYSHYDPVLYLQHKITLLPFRFGKEYHWLVYFVSSFQLNSFFIPLNLVSVDSYFNSNLHLVDKLYLHNFILLLNHFNFLLDFHNHFLHLHFKNFYSFLMNL